jgi:hypothetical protein
MIYLIAHKVRGEPAFDIGIRSECPECRSAGCHECTDGYWWIIPTSGHRAYPYWHYPLGDLFAYKNVGDPPEGLRDHYRKPALCGLSLNEIIACIGEP